MEKTKKYTWIVEKVMLPRPVAENDYFNVQLEGSLVRISSTGHGFQNTKESKPDVNMKTGKKMVEAHHCHYYKLS